jgi:uncharacterized membrane protein
MALLPPFVGAVARELIMDAFAGVCHQLPDRAPHVRGISFALCDRCLGIYGGLAVGVLAFPTMPRQVDRIYRYAGLVLIAALVPLGIDWIGPVIDGWSNGPWSRAGTGALFGAAAGVLVGRAGATFGRNAAPAATRSDGQEAGKR